MAELGAQQAVANQIYTTRTTCRLCGEANIAPVWDFGVTPLANNYVTHEEVAAGQMEPVAPLRVFYCQACHLIQLVDVVYPDLLFRHYLYVSSTSPSFVQHFQEYANHLVERFALTANNLVVDIGSNDGVLLKPFQAAGVRILGVDPAENLAAQATAEGIPTEPDYFTPTVAKKLRARYGPATVITANNVFAHTDAIDTFVAAVQELLADDGVFVFEVQYLRDLLEKNLFDIVYHEHVNYYHVTTLAAYFMRQGMQVFDVQRVPVHGGSIRVYVSKKGAAAIHQTTDRLNQLLGEEQAMGLNSLVPYQAFAQRIADNKQRLRGLLDDLKGQGKRIVGYGAPAKATTLMYAFGLDARDIDYIVDDAPLKQGRLMPGTHVPIYSPEALYGERLHFTKGSQGTPEYCLILAWNFAEAIMKNHARFVEQGGQWIVPVPEPQIITVTT